MSATPPFGPAYDQSPDDGPRRGSHQWQPQAGGPRGAQGGHGQAPGEPGPDERRPQAGGPQAGQGRQMPAAGGRPQAGGGPAAGGPQAGRGQVRPQQSPYGSPQPPGRAQPQQPPQPPHSSPPRQPQQPAQSPHQHPDTPSRGLQSPPPAPADEERAPEPFEEAAFADESAAAWGDEGTTAIGKLGYVPKETRKRSDFQKKRSRARKTSPIPKIIAAVVVLALLGGAGWWWFNRDESSSGDQTQEAASGLTYGKSEDPCSLADPALLADHTGGVEPEMTAEAEQQNSGWEQLCVLTYGAPDSSVALLEFEAVSFESEGRASVNFELEAGQLAELTDSWTQLEQAPEIGDQSAAVAAVVDEGTSNYQLHLQDDNVYMVVRLALVDSGLDQQGFTDLTVRLADSYLAAWRDAS